MWQDRISVVVAVTPRRASPGDLSRPEMAATTGTLRHHPRPDFGELSRVEASATFPPAGQFYRKVDEASG